jgi:Domain of unknown function (DUF1707)/FHA domain
MAGSAADTPATPESVRASDAERDHAINELRQEFVAGRLSHETFMFRMQTALGARQRGQLNRLFTDLPPRRARAFEPAELLARMRAAFRRHESSEEPSRPHENQPPAPLVFPPGSGTCFTIGRTQECDLRIADLSVSRLHAQLARGQDGWLLSDLGSHNGTRVNGWLVREPVPVRAGDVLQFGSATFVIQAQDFPR